jgi:hypothetical protein
MMFSGVGVVSGVLKVPLNLMERVAGLREKPAPLKTENGS